MKHPLSRSRVRKAQLRLVDAMVDIRRFRDFTCAKCGKAMGAIGVRGLSFRVNAQHMGDIVVELQCPHCDSGYDAHYRRAADSMTGFLKLMLALAETEQEGEPWILPEPVNNFDIPPQDNNLLAIMQEGLAARAGKGGKGKKPKPAE